MRAPLVARNKANLKVTLVWSSDIIFFRKNGNHSSCALSTAVFSVVTQRRLWGGPLRDDTKMLCCRLSCAATGQEECFHPNYACFLRGCLHDTGATFAPERVHSGSLPWFYICLHDTATKCHARTTYPGASSPRLLYRGENFTRVRNLATVSCKRETCFGVKSVCR